MKKIAVIILNWNNYFNTKKIVNSILNQEISNLDIYLVDNNSPDGSGERLFEEFNKNLFFYHTGKNGGYTGGNNFGIKKALENNCEYILVLNNDLEINNFGLLLENIESSFNHNKKIGILGFDIYDNKSKKKLQNSGRVDKIFNYIIGVDNSTIDINSEVSLQNKRDVCGCAICFRADCLREIGFFDESFFMYAEEQDICLRAIKHNWSVMQIKSKKVKIFREIDAISENQLIWYFGTRNIFCAYRKNLPFFKRNIFIFIQVLIYSKQIIKSFLKNEKVIVSKIIKGVLDGLFGKHCINNDKVLG